MLEAQSMNKNINANSQKRWLLYNVNSDVVS